MYWPGRNYDSLRKEFVGEFILDMFRVGFSLKEICDNFLMIGTFSSKDFSVTKLKKSPSKYSKFVPSSWRSMKKKMGDWFGETDTRLRSHYYFKPLMLSLYRDGRITRQDLINDFVNTQFFKGRDQFSLMVHSSFIWLQEYILKLDLESMYAQGLSDRTIGIEWGLIPSGLSARDKFSRRVEQRILEFRERLWPGMSMSQLRLFLQTRNLGVSSLSYFAIL